MNDIVDIYKTASAREQFELNYIRETYRDFLRSNLLGLAGIVALMGYSAGSALAFAAVALLAIIGVYININFARHFENLLDSFNTWLEALVAIEDTGDFLKLFDDDYRGFYKTMEAHIGRSTNPKISRTDKFLNLDYETRQSDGPSGRFCINQAKAFIYIYFTILLASTLIAICRV